MTTHPEGGKGFQLYLDGQLASEVNPGLSYVGEVLFGGLVPVFVRPAGFRGRPCELHRRCSVHSVPWCMCFRACASEVLVCSASGP